MGSIGREIGEVCREAEAVLGQADRGDCGKESEQVKHFSEFNKEIHNHTHLESYTKGDSVDTKQPL